MSKFEMNLKLDQLKQLTAKKSYEEAAELAKTIDWKKVKNYDFIAMAMDVQEEVGDYEEACNLAALAYNHNRGGKKLVYRLTELLIKTKRYDDADDMYEEYQKISRGGNECFPLLFNLRKAEGADDNELVEILEDYKESEVDERYMYELAALYLKTGRNDEAVNAADQVDLLFHDGIYVEKCLKIKKKAGGILTNSQEEFLDEQEVKRNDIEATRELEFEATRQLAAIKQDDIAEALDDVEDDKEKKKKRRNFFTNLFKTDDLDDNFDDLDDEEEDLEDDIDDEEDERIADELSNLESDDEADAESDEARPEAENLELLDSNVVNSANLKEGSEDNLPVSDKDKTLTFDEYEKISEERKKAYANPNLKKSELNIKTDASYDKADPAASGIIENADDYEYYDEGFDIFKSFPFNMDPFSASDKTDEELREAEQAEENEASAQEEAEQVDVAETGNEPEEEDDESRYTNLKMLKDVDVTDVKPIEEAILPDEIKEMLIQAKAKINGSYETLSKENELKMKEQEASLAAAKEKEELKARAEAIRNIRQREDNVDISGIEIKDDSLDITRNLQIELKDNLSKILAEEEVDNNPDLLRPNRKPVDTAEFDALSDKTVKKAEQAETADQAEDLVEEQIEGQLDLADWIEAVREEKYGGQDTKKYSKAELERLLEEKDEKSKAYEKLMQEQRELAKKKGQKVDEDEIERRARATMMQRAARTDLDIRTGKAMLRLEEAVDRFIVAMEQAKEQRAAHEKMVAERAAKLEEERAAKIAAARAAKAEELKRKWQIKNEQPVNQVKLENQDETHAVAGAQSDEKAADKAEAAKTEADEKKTVDEADAKGFSNLDKIEKQDENQENASAASADSDEEVGMSDAEALKMVADPTKTVGDIQKATRKVAKKNLRDLENSAFETANYVNGILEEENKAKAASQDEDVDESENVVIDLIDESDLEDEKLDKKALKAEKKAEKKAQRAEKKAEKSQNHDSESADGKSAMAEKKTESKDKKLSGDLAKIFVKYRELPGLEAQLYDYFDSLDQEMQIESSIVGNIIVSGNESADKDDLARTIVRAVNTLYPDNPKKIAKTTGDSLNQRGLRKAMGKLRNTVLLVEGAGQINIKRINEIVECLKEDTGRMIVIFLDVDSQIDVLLHYNPGLDKIFNHRIVLKQYTVNELVEIAKKVARKRSYEIDDDALLTLYLKLDRLTNETDNIKVEQIQQIVFDAIEHSEKRMSRRIFGGIRRKKGNGGELFFLTDADFKD